MQAFSSGARMFLLTKAPCWNSRREEEMGRVKGSGEGAAREGRTKRAARDSTRLIPQMESLLAGRVRDSYFENLGIGRKKCPKVQNLTLVCQMKSFMLDKGRWLRAIKSSRKKANTYNTYLTRSETNSETIQNPELLKKKKKPLIAHINFHSELITSLWGRTWGTFWITNIAPFFFFTISDTNVLILMFLSKRPVKITVQLDYYGYQLIIREILKLFVVYHWVIRTRGKF